MPDSPPSDVTELVLAAFRRAASESPAYRSLLQEHKIDSNSVSDLDTFSTHCPVLNKQKTFGRFSISQLAVPGVIDQAAHFLSSSGYGGSFSLGIETREQAAAAANFVDDALDAAFQIRSRRTLAVNCLPMGVSISSNCMAIATVSVREDIAVSIVEELGPQYDQILLLCDPLFLPCLLAQASARDVAWQRFKPKVILGGEVFGEVFRSHAGLQFGLSEDEISDGHIRSSMGVAELGLHLLYETADTVAVSRAAASNADFSRTMLGAALRPNPMLLTYDADRVFFEIDDPDDAGFGLLTVTLLDPSVSVPLVRYQPGDVAAILDTQQVVAAAHAYGITTNSIPSRMIALRGRHGDILPTGSHVTLYRETLFSDSALAATITGAYRVELDNHHNVTLHVQLAPGLSSSSSVEQTIHEAISDPDRPSRVRLWNYEAFPFGLRLDYERKFRYRS